jgi:hypothetical protein
MDEATADCPFKVISSVMNILPSINGRNIQLGHLLFRV